MTAMVQGVAYVMKCIQSLFVLALSFLGVSTYANTLKPFTTDGCSMFPDSVGSLNWTHCCVTHDFAYWRGGTAEQRQAADLQLAACVNQQTHNPQLAQAMYQGVRFGGSPYSIAPYRWGYGWEQARFYQELTEAERALATTLEAEYWRAQAHTAIQR